MYFTLKVCLFWLYVCACQGFQLRGLRPAAAPDAHVTEAPSADLVEKAFQKRAGTNYCTQWQQVGGGDVGCQGTETCLFATRNGYLYEFCGNPTSPPTFATYCYNYPATWIGNSPTDVAYCPKTAPYCGAGYFIVPGKTFLNLGCSTRAYDLTVITKPGATFPGSTTPTTTSVPIPKPSSTTVNPPETTTSAPVLPTTTPEPSTTPSTSSTTSSTSPTTSSTSSTTPFTTPLTTIATSTTSSTTVPPNASPAAASSTTSSISTTSATAAPETSPTPSLIPCSDQQWEPTPQNWFDADVDHQMALWWANTTDKRGSLGFVDWLARSFGDFSHSQECGIGQSCSPPGCPAFQSSGAPRWAYFVHVSLHEMNVLLNDMKTGLVDAETDLSLIISDMAANFFPWNDPTTDLQKALPWIQAVVSTLLSFIPVIGPLLSIEVKGPISGALIGAAQAITQAGFQELSQIGSDPVTHQLGTIQELGLLIENATKTMRTGLETWGTTLYDGGQDISGKSIMDYMGGGRFTVEYDISQTFMDNFFLKVWVSKLVNEQWQAKNVVPSKTFVMCTNSTSPCDGNSKYTEGSRTCCLYSMNNDATYTSPPSLDVLGNATYNITPSDIVASSLHSYMAQGLAYDDRNIGPVIEQSISLTSNATFLSQGIRFQGVWTLPVCDVGLHGDWVASYAAREMPCCCGPSCSETTQFWNMTGLLNVGAMHDRCNTQCQGTLCAKSGARSGPDIMGMTVSQGIWVLVVAYLVGVLFFGL